MSDGDEIAFIEVIDHGPFPLAQLKKLNLIPSMASVHTELANTPVLKKLFDVTNGQSPLLLIRVFLTVAIPLLLLLSFQSTISKIALT